MLSIKRTTVEGGYSTLNADDIYRQNMDDTHSRTVPIPGLTYRDHERIQNICLRRVETKSSNNTRKYNKCSTDYATFRQ